MSEQTDSSPRIPTPIEKALADPNDPYHELALILALAFEQSARGKGRERHSMGQPWVQQPIVRIGEMLGGSTGFTIGQAIKKLQEAFRLPSEQALPELLGAVIYSAATYYVIQQAISFRKSEPEPDLVSFSLASLKGIDPRAIR